MPFDVTQITEQVKTALKQINKSDANRTAEIQRSLTLCLDEWSDLVKSSSFRTKQDVSVSANTRETVLTGANNDLRYILALKWTDTDNELILVYQDPEYFLGKYDDADAEQGTPQYWTILESTDGYPKIKTNVPTELAGTLTVYYQKDITDSGITQMRSVYGLVDGTIAWFYGKAGDVGGSAYARFLKAAATSRGSDKYLGSQEQRFTINSLDESVKTVQRTLRNKRA